MPVRLLYNLAKSNGAVQTFFLDSSEPVDVNFCCCETAQVLKAQFPERLELQFKADDLKGFCCEFQAASGPIKRGARLSIFEQVAALG